ncbi:hypothetical protein MBGDF03_00868 [Thermoplasmatales archaeon SCGC AB-540-F20]|nr:hypothetical protein MBGDF03_00868 [Thermoplasmatales archaeon SCGC AB-540-F20]
MDKQIRVNMTIVIIIAFIMLSGCTEINGEKSIALLDGTEVTGDFEEIQIVSYELTKERKLLWKNQWENNTYFIIRNALVPWDLNISDIETNITKRSYICRTYLDPNIPLAKHPIEWDNDYFGYLHPIGNRVLITEFELEDTISSWRVNGTAKNVGKSTIQLAMIIVNFYDQQGEGLALKTSFKGDIEPEQLWEFELRYTGEFKNNISYISFKVDSEPFG